MTSKVPFDHQHKTDMYKYLHIMHTYVSSRMTVYHDSLPDFLKRENYYVGRVIQSQWRHCTFTEKAEFMHVVNMPVDHLKLYSFWIYTVSYFLSMLLIYFILLNQTERLLKRQRVSSIFANLFFYISKMRTELPSTCLKNIPVELFKFR